MKKKIFIRLPTPDGDYGYFPVDTTRLGIDALNDLYAQHRVAGKAQKYMPVQQLEPLVTLQLNIDPVLKALRDIREQADVTLQSYGTPGKPLRKLLANLELEALIQAVAECRVPAAEKLVSSILWTLQSAFCELAEERARNEGTVEVLTKSFQEVDRDGAHVAIYEDWKNATLEINEGVALLRQLEVELKRHTDLIDTLHASWQQRLDDQCDGPLQSALYFLESDPECAFLDVFVADGGLPSPSLLQQARAHLAVLTQLKQDRADACVRCKGLLESEIYPLMTRIEETVERLRTLQRDFQRYLGLESRARSHMLNQVVDQDAFLAAERIVSGQEGSILGWKRSAQEAVNRSDDLVRNFPELSALAQRVYDDAQKALEESEESVDLAETPTVDRGARERMDTLSSPPLPTVPKRSPTNTARADELYSLITAVFYVVTFEKPFLSGTNVKNALRTVQQLGRCTEAERTHYEPLLERRYRSDAETVLQNDRVKHRLKKSPCRWISYVPKKSVRGLGRELGKLAHGYQETAEEILEQAQLTKEAVYAAFQRDREQRTEEHKQRVEILKAEGRYRTPKPSSKAPVIKTSAANDGCSRKKRRRKPRRAKSK